MTVTRIYGIGIAQMRVHVRAEGYKKSSGAERQPLSHPYRPSPQARLLWYDVLSLQARCSIVGS